MTRKMRNDNPRLRSGGGSWALRPMPSSPSSGGVLSSWAVATRDKAEERYDIPFASPGRRRGAADLIERSLYRAFASYDKLPVVVRAPGQAAVKPKRSPTIHLPPLDPVRFPRLTNPEPNELSEFNTEQQLRKQAHNTIQDMKGAVRIPLCS